jgi:hypothetical protein
VQPGQVVTDITSMPSESRLEFIFNKVYGPISALAGPAHGFGKILCGFCPASRGLPFLMAESDESSR